MPGSQDFVEDPPNASMLVCGVQLDPGQTLDPDLDGRPS